ncbi:hypothetical protein [Rhodococcus marinonascens]|uniref:hypothetical protein n=1 Tax=Rhodococcus marinonascens TaxID=38311 RepID=UPI000B2150F0|nr:hypothetical protein [Rhodococcus marinonascens]
MSSRNIRRAVSAASAVVVAAGFAVTVGAGVADAAAETVKWSDHFSQFTRTISNVNPHAGETITVSTKLERKVGGVLEYVRNVRDVHPEYLTFKSATANGKSIKLESQGAGVAHIKGLWEVHPLRVGGNTSATFEFK